MHLDVAGEAVPVKIRRNAQAKRLILRVDATSGDVKLTIPKRVSQKAAEKFLLKHTDWIETERAKITVHTVVDGTELPFEGEMHAVRYTNVSPRKVEYFDSEIKVGGPVDMAPARLEKWLREQARERLNECCDIYASQLGVAYNRISIGDMKSRWGSCSSSGTLRFNWRLIMAPFEVLDYVAAHEVAHLREMNHSVRFWQHVAACRSDYNIQRKWLKNEGTKLFQIQF